MEHAWKIKKMYKLLSPTDIKNICKNRNLPINQHLTADTFKNFICSSVGIDNAISLLSSTEVAALLLIKENESLDISHYAIIYAEDGYGTFTQRYQSTYKAVMQNFVRKGILLVDDDNRGDSKLERIRFTFPKEFRDRLPAPFLEIIEGNYKTEDSDVTLRNKISKIYKEPPANIKNNLYVENSLLKFDIDIFKLNTLDRWRQDNLEKYIVKEYRDSKGYIGKNAFWKKINIVKIIIDAFGRLKANQFVSSEGIDSIFQVIYGGKHGINLENILIRAADLGFLSKIILNNKNYYQSKNILEEIPIQAKDYLIPEDNKFLVEINKIPYKCLEQLACLCSFFLDNKKVYIAPDFSRLVKIYHTVKDTDLFNYLRNHSPLLNTKINEIEDKHGKVLLHSNLLIAKINDFKLKAIFAKTYADSNRIIFLPNNYIAFTQEECGNIKKLVVKSGLAVKNI
jgi:hypothetical protein